jgi:transposase, IS5 family
VRDGKNGAAQKRGVFGAIRRELRRRSAVKPVISHMKAEDHLGRCYLRGRDGDAANAVLTAAGHNVRLVLIWLSRLLLLILRRHSEPCRNKVPASTGFLTDEILVQRA